MTFLSLADACRCLGIDAKTLRRWLEDAQLPLQSLPRDGRKKGVSREHLELLARLHHRRLASLPEYPPPPVPATSPPLPTALLALPETLCALQAQIAALQQVVDLTSLLQRQLHPPASSPTPAPQPKQTRRPPTSPAPRSRPAASATAKTPPRPTHVIPRVEYGHEGR